MKKILILLIVTFIPLFVYSQTTQKGIVREYKGKQEKTALPGVELEIKGANNTTSDKKGNFLLEFRALKPGDKVNYRKIEKDGYIIFNLEAINQWNLSPNTPFMIVMCRADRFKKLCDTYKSNSSKSYREQYEKEQRELQRLRKENKIKDEEYERRLNEISASYERQLDNLDNYVDRFARIDLSDLQPVEQEILELIQAGKMDEAIARYEEENYVGKYLQEIDDIEKLTESIDKLESLREAKGEDADKLRSSVLNYIDALLLKGGEANVKKVAGIYRQIAEKDSSDINLLINAGNFFSKYSADYETALHYFSKALNSALAQFGENNSDVAISYNNIGLVYHNQGDYNRALENYEMALKIQAEIFGENHPDVATSYNNIGMVFYCQGNYNRALENYEMALKIQAEIFGENHPNVATCYSNIGYVFSHQGDYNRALENLEKALKIRAGIFGEKHPDVIVTYKYIEKIHNKLDKPGQALE